MKEYEKNLLIEQIPELGALLDRIAKIEVRLEEAEKLVFDNLSNISDIHIDLEEKIENEAEYILDKAKEYLDERVVAVTETFESQVTSLKDDIVELHLLGPNIEER